MSPHPIQSHRHFPFQSGVIHMTVSVFSSRVFATVGYSPSPPPPAGVVVAIPKIGTLVLTQVTRSQTTGRVSTQTQTLLGGRADDGEGKLVGVIARGVGEGLGKGSGGGGTGAVVEEVLLGVNLKGVMGDGEFCVALYCFVLFFVLLRDNWKLTPNHTN